VALGDSQRHSLTLDSLEDETGSGVGVHRGNRAVTTRRGDCCGGDVGRLSGVNVVVGFAHQTGVKLAEVGFLLVLIAGVWLVSTQILQLKMSKARTIVAGVALATGGLLLIIATHWGHFG
jgi:hypothetical protein